MTVGTDVASDNVRPRARNLHRLAGMRVEKLAQLVLPPGHEPILDVMATIWLDGVVVGLQMSEEKTSIGLSSALAEALYERLESAELCSEYEEFPELDDRDFQDLACRRVDKISQGIHPAGHPDVMWDKAEIWTDGVATALRIVRDGGRKQA
ncbi:hypothetical protein MTER_31770 [Mycolicibacter terrae]|uniref:Uncharacterized protein n=1 Tax=Mycolicibacter terrae TaxID=1788 RepID=A0AAD1I015_9MYCO|nr:hypothetical protein [Mycolicibacter terrae]ORW88671.1 hypothetical protein AWC28_05615 [Mycolicibacter terrae]BBX23766.1 hypothetical protein MTER_31770 [Mycolicibacter terrae]